MEGSMPLICCTACGREISTAATACPHCGHPNRPASVGLAPTTQPEPGEWSPRGPTANSDQRNPGRRPPGAEQPPNQTVRRCARLFLTVLALTVATVGAAYTLGTLSRLREVLNVDWAPPAYPWA